MSAFRKLRVADDEDERHRGGYPHTSRRKEKCFSNQFTYHDAAWHGQKGVGDMVDEDDQYHGKEQSPSTAHERQHCAGGRGGSRGWGGPSSCLCVMMMVMVGGDKGE